MDPENWSQLEVVLGTSLLADICGPFDDGLEPRRLELLIALVTHLRTRYDNAGVREWFVTADADGRTPAAVLSGAWSPDDETAQRLASAAP